VRAIIGRVSVAENSAETAPKVIGRPFEPGRSGNPGGRPKGIARTVREQAGGNPEMLVALLLEIAQDPRAVVRDRLAAVKELLDRGWGKAPAFSPIEGRDPLEEDEISSAIREIADELAARRNGKGTAETVPDPTT